MNYAHTADKGSYTIDFEDYQEAPEDKLPPVNAPSPLKPAVSIEKTADIPEQSNEKAEQTNTIEELGTLEVEGTTLQEPAFKINPTKSSTTITLDTIKRRQANDVAELLEGIPGISAAGGNRTSGKAFNIRGFADNEDILTVIDGARQNFERYRYGNGVDIEPLLLKQVEVVRGSSVRTAGSGAIGGAVLLETKNARDLLEPGVELGLTSRVAYNTNSNLKKGSTTFVAQPLSFADVLVNVVKNTSNDITLAGGSRLENSESKQLSGLVKIGIFGLDYDIDIGYRYSDESVFEPFDIVDSATGLFGNVRRERTTRSPTLNFTYDPNNPYINLRGTVAYNSQTVFDEESQLAGGGNDLVEYDIVNLELANTIELNLGYINGSIDVGLQSSQEKRTNTRFLPNGDIIFNASQPPGEKLTYGAFIDTNWQYKDLSINAGVRYDDFSIKTEGPSEVSLEAQDRPTENGFDDINFGAGISYTPLSGPITLFYNYSQAFRAPLIDEYYSLGDFSRCESFSQFTPQPPFFPPAAFIAFLNDPFASTNASCADFYEPENSDTHEIGFTLDWSRLLKLDGLFTTKLTYFQINTTNIIESIFENSVTGEISQPGVEFREGFEVEIAYDNERWFSNLAISTVDGYVEYNYFENNNNPSVLAIPVPPGGRDILLNRPGDNLSFSIGYRIPQSNFEVGYRLRAVESRIATNGIDNSIPGCANASFFTIPSCFEFGEEAGYVLHNLFSSWKPIDSLRIGLTMNNITNKNYRTQGFGGGIGVLAPGRDLRASVEYQF